MGFGNLNDVKPSDNRLPYLEPGNYLLEINACKEVNGQKGTSFVVEFTILESDVASRPVGSEMSWVCGMAGGIDLQRQNIKAFLIAALGEDPGPHTNDLLARVTGPANAFLGRTVKCFAQSNMSKPKPGFPNGTPYTRANWSSPTYAPGEAPPTLAALLAAPGVAAPPPPGYRQGPAVGGFPPPPPPPPPPNPRAGWTASPDGAWLLNPATNQWEPK